MRIAYITCCLVGQAIMFVLPNNYYCEYDQHLAQPNPELNPSLTHPDLLKPSDTHFQRVPDH